MAKVRMVHVPYKGGAASATDLIGGQIQVGFNTMPVAAPHIRAGKLKLLAVTEERRSSAFPDAPTVAEAGVPGYAMPVWYGLMAPAGTPREAIALLNREIERVLKDPEVRERFATLGVAPIGGAPVISTTGTKSLRGSNGIFEKSETLTASGPLAPMSSV